jgi:hypothetical protein
MRGLCPIEQRMMLGAVAVIAEGDLCTATYTRGRPPGGQSFAGSTGW